MPETRMVPPLHVCYFYSPRANRDYAQVRTIFVVMWQFWVDSPEFCRRIYAVTMKNIPIALGFASITASQLALGVTMTILSARKGGEPRHPNPSGIHSPHSPAPSPSCLRSSNASIDTPRRVYLVRILPA